MIMYLQLELRKEERKFEKLFAEAGKRQKRKENIIED